MPILFVIGLLAPACLVAVTLVAAWVAAAEADRQQRDEETALTRSREPKPPGLGSLAVRGWGGSEEPAGHPQTLAWAVYLILGTVVATLGVVWARSLVSSSAGAS